MKHKYRMRRMIVGLVSLVVVAVMALQLPESWQAQPSANQSTQNQQSQKEQSSQQAAATGDATEALATLPIKGRAPKTDYARTQYGSGWTKTGQCDTRNIILNRDMTDVKVDEKCRVLSGVLNDPYTGGRINFQRGASTSDDVQIDHVVALSDSWQKGAQQLAKERRVEFANDPLNLLAVDGPANQEKSDGDAATWLPPNKAFRCQYVSRQIAVKQKYQLWVTQAEHDAMLKVLSDCPGQKLPSEK